MKTFKNFADFGQAYKEENLIKESLEDKLDRHVIAAIKKKKLARFPVNATDDWSFVKGKPALIIPSPTGEMVIHIWLRKMAPSKGQPKGVMAFNYRLEDK